MSGRVTGSWENTDVKETEEDFLAYAARHSSRVERPLFAGRKNTRKIRRQKAIGVGCNRTKNFNAESCNTAWHTPHCSKPFASTGSIQAEPETWSEVYELAPRGFTDRRKSHEGYRAGGN